MLSTNNKMKLQRNCWESHNYASTTLDPRKRIYVSTASKGIYTTSVGVYRDEESMQQQEFVFQLKETLQYL